MEDTVTFAEVDTPIVNTTPMSDDTLQRPFSVDYLTKYRLPPDEVDSLPHDSELEEVSSNAHMHGEQVNELLFTEIDARYDQPDGVLEKDFHPFPSKFHQNLLLPDPKNQAQEFWRHISSIQPATNPVPRTNEGHRNLCESRHSHRQHDTHE